MIKTRFSQKGFSAVEVVLLLVIVAMLGGVGWYVLNANKEADDGYSSTSSSVPAPSVEDVPDVNNANDLTEAENYLNDTNIDQQLDTGDIDALLGD